MVTNEYMCVHFYLFIYLFTYAHTYTYTYLQHLTTCVACILSRYANTNVQLWVYIIFNDKFDN